MENLDHTEHEDDQSQLKALIAKGKEQGFLTYHEVNDHLPDDIVDPEQIEDIINMINDMGIYILPGKWKFGNKDHISSTS